MKKTLILVLSVVVTLSICLLTMTACKTTEYIGTYEMVQVAGTITRCTSYNSYFEPLLTTKKITQSNFNYFCIKIKASGKAIMESQLSDGRMFSSTYNWAYRDGKLSFYTTDTEKSINYSMQYNDGTLYFPFYINEGSGVSTQIVELNFVLKKKN